MHARMNALKIFLQKKSLRDAMPGSCWKCGWDTVIDPDVGEMCRNPACNVVDAVGIDQAGMDARDAAVEHAKADIRILFRGYGHSHAPLKSRTDQSMGAGQAMRFATVTVACSTGSSPSRRMTKMRSILVE